MSSHADSRAAAAPEAGYLGPRGTFTEEAARRYQERTEDDTRLVPYDDIPTLLRAVDRGALRWAVVPIENSLEGTVAITVDMLVHEIASPIVGEVMLPVRHHLLVPPGLQRDRIEVVLSHPQALAQCRGWLEKALPHARPEATASTAEAARQVAAGERPFAAAIANAAAAALYGLHTAARDIQDSGNNMTRFVAVGGPVPGPTGDDKTSLAFAFPEDRPGNLYRALGEFARRNINLSKLESRPAKKALGNYVFLIDLEGHQDDAIVAEALAALRDQCSLCKVLGSYPRSQPETNGP